MQIRRVTYKISRGHYRDMVPPDYILDSYRKADHKPQRKPLLQIPSTSLWTLTAHCIPNPHLLPSVASSLYMLPRTATRRARFDRRLGSMTRKQAKVFWQKTNYKPELQRHLQENKRQAVSIWPGALQDRE